MGDESIDMVILHIDMGYLVTINLPRHPPQYKPLCIALNVFLSLGEQ